MIDPESATWKALRNHLQARRQRLLEDSTRCPDWEAHLLIRGRIRQIDEVLKLERPQEVPVAAEGEYL